MVHFSHGCFLIEHDSIELTKVRHVAHQDHHARDLAEFEQRYAMHENRHVVTAVDFLDRGDPVFQAAFDHAHAKPELGEGPSLGRGVDPEAV